MTSEGVGGRDMMGRGNIYVFLIHTVLCHAMCYAGHRSYTRLPLQFPLL